MTVIVIALICSFCLSTTAASIPIVAHSTVVQQSTAQPGEVPTGTLVERLICAQDPAQSYALYLPSNYSTDKKWPVLIAFDPGARGKLPVERYKDAAEKWGWIVIGSNNSRNGPMRPSLDAWKAIVTDSQQRFRIDEQRVYLTGLSGGARLVIYFAAQCQGCIAGVIASAAGFPGGLSPSTAMRFPIFGTTGVDDFNFAEMRELEPLLIKARITNHIEVFNGRHEWPPADVAGDAIEWMELQAMKAGTRARDANTIESLWDARLRQARALDDSKKTYDAYRAYATLVETFKDLRDVKDAQLKLAQLRDNPTVKSAIRDEQRQITRQREMEQRLRSLIAASQRIALKDSPEVSQETGRSSETATADPGPETHLRNLISDLRKQAAKADDGADRRVARRVLDGAFIGLFEQGTNQLQTQKRYDDAVRTFSLASEVNPDRAGTFFYLAWAHAALGDKKKSLRALKTAVDRGFSDLAAITSNKVFDSVRDDLQYKEIIHTLASKH
jgi:predicted esterase